MMAWPVGVRVFLATAPVDMRCQYDGLWAAARERLGEDPRGGALFAFTNRARTRLKILYFDGTGVWVLAKRLEKGRFSWPTGTEPKVTLAPEALALIAGGIDLKKTRAKAWYGR